MATPLGTKYFQTILSHSHAINLDVDTVQRVDCLAFDSGNFMLLRYFARCSISLNSLMNVVVFST